jgi:hypothetical protein
MSSYISSFKAILAALVVIAGIEATSAMVFPSTAVERAGYINWNFNTVEPFHKILINEKLANAVRDQPDVIQVGDSSGFHAIVPRIVDQYLGGLRYENLSCCANTGFDGYYTLIDFMLRHAPSIKAVVFYVSLNNTPRDPATISTESVGGEERLRNAFGPLSAVVSPPTLALRQDVLRWVYTYGHTYLSAGSIPFEDSWPELIQSIRDTRGWRPEEDVHRVAEKQAQKLAELCGPTGVRPINGHRPEDFMRDILGSRHSFTQIELRRLAALTARHQAKLILIIQPYPCRAIVGSFVPSLEADVETVMSDYPNLIVPDPALFEAWPGQWFSSPDHLATGYEDAVSRRAGRLIARALGIRFAEPPPPPAPKPPEPVYGTGTSPFSSWKVQGLSLTSEANAAVFVEKSQFGLHLVEHTLPSLPAGTYTASIRFRMKGDRQLMLQFQPVQWAGNSGHFYCSASAGEVARTMTVLDATVERLDGGILTCSGKFRLTRPGTTIRIGLSPTPFWLGPFQGDASNSVTIYDFELSAVDNVE